MQSILKVLALSYKNTPLEIREQLAFDEAAIKSLLKKIQELLGIQEALILSTCNRTELYYTSEEDRSGDLLKLVSIEKQLNDHTDLSRYFIAENNAEVVTRHLFRVSLGLDAQVMGDIQISNQVKNAYQWSADENMAGPFLHRLMHSIFFANKKVVQETAFRDGAASVSYATVEQINEITSSLGMPRILVLGLGEIGEDVVRNLAAHSRGEITLCNRTAEKATKLAAEFGFKTLSYGNVFAEMHNYDVIVSSVRAQEPVISKESIRVNKILSHKFFMDLSVPRSIHENIEQIPGVLLYNIDEIQQKTNETLERRKRAIPQVEKIVDEAVAELSGWTREMEVSPTIKKLKGALEDIRQAEIARHLKKMNTREAELMNSVTKGMMQKILKLPVLQLKAACQRGEADTLIDVLNDLFDLEKQALNSK